MKKNLFLIRSSKQDQDRISMQLDNFKKNNVDFCVVEENYSDPSVETHFKSDNHIVVGPDYLNLNNLANFNRVGWQCGDYVGYVGYHYFPNYDFYWIVDSDLYLNIDLDRFVSHTNEFEFDLLGTNYTLSNDRWVWHKTMSKEYDDVYKMLYCLLRLSNKAISFLKEKRSSYHPKIEGDKYNIFFANDEAFTATVLTNSGFSSKRLQSVVPQYFSNDLLCLNRVFYIDELKKSYAKDQIIHPVCNAKRIQSKINSLKKKPEQLTQITYRFFCNFEQEECNEITKIPLLEVYKKHYNSDVIVNLMEISNRIKMMPNIKRVYFLMPTIYVLDFHLKGIEFGIDITADASLFIVPRNIKSKDIIRQMFNNDGGKVCVIKQHLYINRDLNISLKKSFCENIFDFIIYTFQVIEVNALSEVNTLEIISS